MLILAQEKPGITHTALLKAQLQNTDGKEVLVWDTEYGPGAINPRHLHPYRRRASAPRQIGLGHHSESKIEGISPGPLAGRILFLLAKQGGFPTKQGWLFGRSKVIIISS